MRIETSRKIAAVAALPVLAFLLSAHIFHIAGLKRSSVVFGIAFCAAVALTPLVRRLAFAVRALDIPDERKIHATPTPLLGGLVVFVSLAISLFFFADFSREIIGVLIATAMIFATGLIDDISGGIPSIVRIFVQLAAAATAVYFGACFRIAPGAVWGHAFSVGVTVVWMVGMTNAVNFIDGLDGLAGGTSAISAAFFFALGHRINNPW